MSYVTQEMTYYKLTHLAEFSENRQLFIVRGVTVSYGQKLESLTPILSSEKDSLAERAGVVMLSNQ